MKKYATLVLLIAIAIGCAKKTSSPSTTSGSGNNSTSSMNSTEQSLTAKWYLKEVNTRDSSTHSYTALNYYNNPAIYLNLMSMLDTNRSGPYVVTGYKADPTTVPIACQHTWTSQTDSINFLYPMNPGTNHKYAIQLLTADSLILRTGGTVNQYTQRFYFHK